MELIDDDAFEAANRRGAEMKAKYPAILAARYDKVSMRIVLALDSDMELSILPHHVAGFEQAHPDDLDVVEISPSGLSVHFPKIGADIYIPLLFEQFLGPKRSIAAAKRDDVK